MWSALDAFLQDTAHIGSRFGVLSNGVVLHPAVFGAV